MFTKRQSKLGLSCLLAATVLAALLPTNAAADWPREQQLGTLTGTVVDIDGYAVAEAMVVIYTERGAAYDRTMTGREGDFAFKLPAGRYEIKAGFNEFPSGRDSVSIRARETLHRQITINEATRLGGIKGTVIDKSRQPVKNALVEVYDSNGTTMGRQTTDTQGYFEFTSLLAGDYSLKAGLDQFPSGGTRVSVRAGDTTSVEIMIEERDSPGFLAGLVVNRAGRPVAHATVQITDERGNAIDRQVTRGDGSFEVELSPGKYMVLAGREQFPSGRAEVVIRSDETTDLTITIGE
jgi:protocatechuate 3,4-dioxygenase beta subunit